MVTDSKRTKVFISYSHKDAKYLEGFLPHLKYYERNKRIDYWADTKIRPGVNWREEVEQALASAKVAVLLISIDYLTSQFIIENELPPLLAAAQARGVRILPVILRPCALDKNLSQFQPINSPSMPLAKMKGYERDELWVKVMDAIKDTMDFQQAEIAPANEYQYSEMASATSSATYKDTRPMTQSIYELLADCTVRIVARDFQGTGFFVAPGFILTCSDVIEPAQKTSAPIEVSWKGQTFPAQIAAFRDVIYPDLALLQVSIPNHSCVLLYGSVEPFSELYGFGYADIESPGAPTTIACEGWVGAQHELLRLKEGQVRPSMSGSPVLKRETGTVCGIVQFTLNRNNALGGIAMLTQAIFRKFPELEEQQKQFHQQDKQWVARLTLQQRQHLQSGWLLTSIISSTIKIVYCYAYEDKALRDELDRHLGALKRSGKISTWHDREILPGEDWEDGIKKHLNDADIILLLVSPDFMDSDYCYEVEMRRALERHQSGEAYVLSIILRPVDWEETPIGEFQALPSNGEPVTQWSDRDAAFRDIAKGIRNLISALSSTSQDQEKESGDSSSEESSEITDQSSDRAFTRNKARLGPHTKLKLFCSYADEDKELWNEFQKHLHVWQRIGYVSELHSTDERIGPKVENDANPNLEAADVILLLISPDYLSSDYCYNEMLQALNRYKTTGVLVVPVILYPVYWEGLPFDELEVLPFQRNPISRWPNRDEGFLQVLNELREIVGITSPASLQMREREEGVVISEGANSNQTSSVKSSSNERPVPAEQMKPLKIFYRYAHEDEDLKTKFEKHLSAWKRHGQISEWYGLALPESDWEHEIDPHLETADMILFFISTDFLFSSYSDGAEIRRALTRHRSGEALVTPILLRPVDRQVIQILFGKIAIVPANEQPVTQWVDREEAFWQVGEEIREAARKFLSQKKEVDSQTISQVNTVQEIQPPPISNERKDSRVSNLTIHAPVQGLVYGENNTVTINIQGNEHTIPFLAPPQPIQALVGRENLLRDLKQKLFSGGNLALTALNGLPGVGKTALALALAHDREVLAHFSDGILWAGLGREASVFSYLSAWGIALGISQADIEKQTSVTTLARAIHGAIGLRRMLLIIDDAWSTEDSLAFKLGGPNCAHLVTTRLPEVAERFADEGTITVRELNERDSVTLLEQQAPEVSLKAPEEIRAIIQAVDGLPLPLILMGNYLRIQMKTEQPRRLRAALDRLLQVKERLQLAQPQGGIEHHPSLPEGIPLSQLAVIQISDEALDKGAQQALRALSVFPSKPNSFSEKAALAVAATNNQAIDTLLDFGLLESSGPERYTLHQTISDYARVHLTDSTAYERMVEFFIEYVEANKTDQRSIERETSNILAAVQITFAREMQVAFGRGAKAFAYFFEIFRRSRFR